jgi:Ca2+:H+ antiporter
MKLNAATPWWALTWPALACVILIMWIVVGAPGPLAAAAGFVLIATVFGAVYHAEVVAHRVGEPFGTLILALAVTIIEVALIVSIMVKGGADTAELARDTVFAAVMIVCNGIVGFCLLFGGMRHHTQGFRLQGANTALSVLIALTTLSLVLPNVTASTAGQTFSSAQLVFAGLVSLVLYGSFVFVQTIRHRDFFLAPEDASEETHAAPPTNQTTLVSAGLLLVSLVAIVGLAKMLTPSLERGIEAAGAPKSLVGVIIAALVLLPEGLAALRAARLNRLQTSMNLALGSVLASIGLTIPAVAAVSIALGIPLTLGLNPKEEVFLALTLIVSVSTLATGRTTVMQGIVHVVIFAVFLFLVVVP